MKEKSEKVLSISFSIAVVILLIIANIAPAEVRFWWGFLPLGIITSLVIGVFIGAGIDSLGRWWGALVLVVAAALLLVGSQIASQDLAGKASDLKDYVNWSIARGLIWWVCSLVPMIAATISAWRNSGEKNVR